MATSCKKPVNACIEVSSNSAAVDEEITFSSQCTENALSYLLSFEGPAGAAENNMQRSESLYQFSFGTAGNYKVTLEAYQNYSWVGEVDSTSTTITIN